MNTCERFEEAMAMAQTRDEELRQALSAGTQDQLPPLHGIPISLKDIHNVNGMTSSNGIAHLCDEVITEDSVTFKLFVKAGAIPIAKSNVS